MSIDKPPKLPIIHEREMEEFGEGRFRIERIDLEFSNGARRHFERHVGRGPGAVIVAALPDPETILLIREYAAGTNRYELGLPRGRIDRGEEPLEAANRELKEEAGFGGRKLTLLRALTLAPTYMSHQTWLVLAEDLYPERLPGDEPEELEVIPWRLDRLHELMLRDDCSEGRSLAAMYIVRDYIAHRDKFNIEGRSE